MVCVQDHRDAVELRQRTHLRRQGGGDSGVRLSKRILRVGDWGFCVLSFELWVMGYGLWVMGYGLWVMGYGFCVLSFEF